MRPRSSYEASYLPEQSRLFDDSKLEPSDDEDEDYEDQDSNVDEPLEWDSEAEVEPDSIQPDALECEDQDATAEKEDYRESWKRAFTTNAASQHKPAAEERFESLYVEVPVSNRVLRSDSNGTAGRGRHRGRVEQFEGYKLRYESPKGNYYNRKTFYEHIAGPECEHGGGYNGNVITAEEAGKSLTLQCLMRKNEFWKPEADDEDFERSSSFFFTGLSDHMPSRDMASPQVFPVRHRLDYPNAENVRWAHGDPAQYAMPFHPYCLEVYKRASQLRLHKPDIEALGEWWTKEADYDMFHRFPRHPAVDKASHQSWEHNPGDEFLVANPLFVPGLDDILRSAVRTQSDFDVRGSPFDGKVQSPASNNNDPFAVFPEELRAMLLAYLNSKDIASLRLASRSFKHLPIALWHDLLKREMPWLWEVWSQTPYSGWATTTRSVLEQKSKILNGEAAELDWYFSVLDSDLPEMKTQNAEVRAACEHELAQKTARLRQPAMHPVLEWQRTDWHAVYLGIRRRWKEMRGLQNRERIWMDCEEIVRRIRGYRERGEMEGGNERGLVLR